jgi:hypothetical protein
LISNRAPATPHSNQSCKSAPLIVREEHNFSYLSQGHNAWNAGSLLDALEMYVVSRNH